MFECGVLLYEGFCRRNGVCVCVYVCVCVCMCVVAESCVDRKSEVVFDVDVCRKNNVHVERVICLLKG